MQISAILLSIGVLLVLAFNAGRMRVETLSVVRGLGHSASLPFYYGMLTMLWTALPAILFFFAWLVFHDNIIDAFVYASVPESFKTGEPGDRDLLLNQIYNIAFGSELNSLAPAPLMESASYLKALEERSRWFMAWLIWISMGLTFLISVLRCRPSLRARIEVEGIFHFLFFLAAFAAVIITCGILFSVIFESLRFFDAVPLSEFLFGTTWDPQLAIREDQDVESASFGALPLMFGTFLVAGIALVVAVPTGVMSAVYLSEYASSTVRVVVKPLLEILAGIPTVVYGFFAIMVISPSIQHGFAWLFGDNVLVSAQSALAVGLALSIMIIPFISSISDDVINAVPQSVRDGALALGATQSEVVKQVVIPSALPGIMSGVLLAASRALGETMIVVMAAGLAANLTLNPLESVTTVTVQIKTLLEGDQEFDSPKTLAAFALGLVLFLGTMCLNYIALNVVKKFKYKYD